MVIEEAALKTGVIPTSAGAFASSKARPSIDWVLHFASGKPKLGERLFEESSRLHELQCRPKIAQFICFLFLVCRGAKLGLGPYY